MNDAFDAVDAPALTVADLARIRPEHWPLLVFKPQPSAVRLDCYKNVPDIWLALKEGCEPPKPRELTDPAHVLVWREDVTKFRLLATEEAMMWDEAAKGVCFGALCELVATFNGLEGADSRAARYLQGWISTGLLTGGPP